MNPLSNQLRVAVEFDGSPAPVGDVTGMPAVLVRQRMSLPTLCELTFVDPAGPLREGRSVKPGQSMVVKVSSSSEPLFDGEVTAVEYSVGPATDRTVRVRGYDRLHRLRKRQQVKTHDNMTTVDLIKSLTDADGLTVEAGSIANGTVRPKVFQNRQSDFDLLAEQAQRANMMFNVRGKKLYLLTAEGTGDAVDLTVGHDLLETRVELNGDSVCKSVTTTAWNFGRAEPHRGVADAAKTGRGTAAEVLPGAFSVTGERFISGELVQDDTEAGSVAQAELDRRQTAAVTFQGVADGNPLLRPGQPVNVHGIATMFDGIYTITSADHTVDGDRGYQTEISSAPPARVARTPGTVVTLGIVKRVDDPDGLGRIRVAMPAYNDAETNWIGVVTAGAGKGKGMVSLPDVDDQVAVLCSQEDLSQGVVLGGLYGVNAPPDTGIDGTAVRRFSFITPGGQKIRLDDGKKTVRLENAGGSFAAASKYSVKMTDFTATRVPGAKPGVTAHVIYKPDPSESDNPGEMEFDVKPSDENFKLSIQKAGGSITITAASPFKVDLEN